MKYFGIIDESITAIFQLQWKIENISDMFLQYSVLCANDSFAQGMYKTLFLTFLRPKYFTHFAVQYFSSN